MLCGDLCWLSVVLMARLFFLREEELASFMLPFLRCGFLGSMTVGLPGLRMCNFMMLSRSGASKELSLLAQGWDEDAGTSQFCEEQMSLAEFIAVSLRPEGLGNFVFLCSTVSISVIVCDKMAMRTDESLHR